MQNEEPIIESPMGLADSQPSMAPASPDGPKKKTGLIIAIVVVVVLLVVGGFVALFLIEKAKAEENEKRAAAVTVDDDVELGKRGYKSTKKKENSTESEEDEEESEEEEEDQTADETKYLEPAGWAVKFKYPDGVTDIKYEIQDVNYDGEIFITSVVTADKIYDINICGGKVLYEQYPFFLGQVSRWNPNASHEDWQTSPVSMGLTLAFKEAGIEYFVDSNNGNGCATGDENPDYIEAVRLAKALIGNIEKK